MSAAGWAFATGTTIGFIRNPTSPIQNIGWGVVGASITNPTSRSLLIKAGLIVASDLYVVGSAASTAFTATRTGGAIISAGSIGLAVAAGGVIGAAGGTAISSALFGSEGKEKAIEFYTGQANLIDYVPHYNVYQIIKHYV
jgi:hypothetical protein